MEIVMTIDATKPFTYPQRQMLRPDTDLIEYFCTENERDITQFK
jgi:hypothetical protein